MKSVVLWGGCGTVGQRVRDAIGYQDDLEVYAIVTRTAKENVLTAYEQGIRIFTSDPSQLEDFRELGINDIGTVDELLMQKDNFDIIVDCTPAGEGERNVREFYHPHGVRAILQGGENPDSVEMSFNALVNFDEARDKQIVRVVSCNTTGSIRVLQALEKKFGVKFASATIDRRGNDPHQSSKLPRGSINKPSLNSHHGPDIVTVIKDFEGKVKTKAKKSDKQEFHSHEWNVVLEREATREEILEVFQKAERVMLLKGSGQFVDDGKIRFWAKERWLRGDIYETIVWPAETIDIEDIEGRSMERGIRVRFDLLVDQQCIVVPEIIDAIRAMLHLSTAEESIKKTDTTLGIDRARKQI